jgi:hypothetical protein
MGRFATTALLLLAGVLNAAAQPANDDCADATVIASLPFVDSLVTTTASSEAADPPLHCNFDFDEAGRTVWYSYTAPQDVALEVSTAGSDYGAVLSVHAGACGALTQLACQNVNGIEAQPRVFVAVVSGETVLIEVADEGFTGGNLELSVTHAPLGHPAHDGPEFLVNTYTTGDQSYYFFSDKTSVCTDATGNFVVVWEGDHAHGAGQDGSYSGVFGQRFASDGTPQGSEFQVNVTTLYYQEDPSVGCDPDGDFVVAWADSQFGTESVVARLYDGSGAPTTGEITVDSVGCCDTLFAAKVGVDGGGSFVVAYSRNADAIYARRFDATGTPLAAAFQVSTTVSGGHYETDIAVADDGAFVVVWEAPGVSGDDVRGRRYDSSGSPLGGEFTANSHTTASQREPAIAMDASGNFVIAWEGAEGTEYGAIARRFDAAGTPQGAEFLVSTNTNANVYSVDVATDAAGNFMVVWDDPADVNDIFLRRYDTAGAAIGDVELKVNTTALYNYFAPKVAAAPGGDFVVVWTGYDGQDPETGYVTGGYGVQAQRFTTAPEPPAGCGLAARTDCKQPTIEFKGRLAMKDKSPDKGDSLVWKWVRGDATSQAEIGDPLGADSYFVCLYDGGGTRVSASAVDPGGTCGVKPCWKGLGTPLGSKGYKYVNKETNDAGVAKLILKPGEQGKAKAIAKIKGDDLDMPSLPLALPATIQLVSTTGTCWSAAFEPAGVLKNTDTVFAAKSAIPSGSPSGAFLD